MFYPPEASAVLYSLQSTEYTLHALIEFIPINSYLGHYVCYIKNHSKGEWWRYDDHKVTLETSMIGDIRMADACLIFYVRSDVLLEEVS